MLSTALPALFSNSWNLHSGGENKVFRPHYNIFSSPILWHLWNMRPPSLGLTLFMCHPATYLSIHNVSIHCTAVYMILQKNQRIQEYYILLAYNGNLKGLSVPNQITKWHYSAFVWVILLCPIFSIKFKWEKSFEKNSCTSGQSSGRGLLWDFWEAASIQTWTFTLLLLSGCWSWSLHAVLQFLSQPGEAREAMMLSKIADVWRRPRTGQNKKSSTVNEVMHFYGVAF